MVLPQVKMFYAHWFLFILVIRFEVFLAEDPIVHLPNGKILGRVGITIQNKTYYAFEGIPYATPPIGELRFQPPQPSPHWSGILNTTYVNKICFQTSEDVEAESEDCLYINVYTPKLLTLNRKNNLPVMFFIYGGGFNDGKSTFYNSPDLFVNEDVILVTFSYRVGVFGFLSTQDKVIPGNNGLKDQQFAIEWTHNHIHLFGGDRKKITIVGHSAGSASLCYQLLNPKSQGLFRSAILQSGSCISPWAYQRNSREVAFKTASFLNETFTASNDSQALLEFLRNVEARDLDNAARLSKSSALNVESLEIAQGFAFAPVIEPEHSGAFITEKMYKLLKGGDFIKVPVLIGITSEESLMFNPIPVVFMLMAISYDLNPKWLVPNDMKILNETLKNEMGIKIREIYTNETFASSLGNGIKYSSDNSFTRSVIKHAELSSKFVNTYFYVFSHHGPMGYLDIYYDDAETVAHGEEIFYFFCTGEKCEDSNFPEADRITRRRLIKLWTDFAKYGNPTPEPSSLLQNITWPVFDSNSAFPYLDIAETLSIKNHPKQVSYKKWNELYESLGHSDFDTY